MDYQQKVLMHFTLYGGTVENFEYYCNSCMQLRLCCKHPFTGCGNCGSQDVIKGVIGSLDKEELSNA